MGGATKTGFCFLEGKGRGERPQRSIEKGSKDKIIKVKGAPRAWSGGVNRKKRLNRDTKPYQGKQCRRRDKKNYSRQIWN